MIKIILWVVGILVLLAIAGGAIFVYMFNQPGPDISEVDHLREPRIAEVDDQTMLVVSDTSVEEIGDAYSVIFAASRLIEGVDQQNITPLGRWNFAPGEDGEDIIGEVGIPVPNSVDVLPEKADGSIKLVTWEYGTVAEILHEGSYASEPATVERLETFIDEQGYEISGEHEEEYLKGPGLFFSVNPDSYLTIIRYQVEKK